MKSYSVLNSVNAGSCKELRAIRGQDVCNFGLKSLSFSLNKSTRFEK